MDVQCTPALANRKKVREVLNRAELRRNCRVSMTDRQRLSNEAGATAILVTNVAAEFH